MSNKPSSFNKLFSLWNNTNPKSFCVTCEGKGRVPKNDGTVERCKKCKGSGREGMYKYTDYFTWVKTSEYIPDFEFNVNGVLVSGLVIIWDHEIEMYNAATLYKNDTNCWWRTADDIEFPVNQFKYWMPISPPPVPEEE